MFRTGMWRAAVAGVLVCIVGVAPLEAQRNETLLGNNRSTRFGGFGGPVVKFSRMAGEDAVINGGRGGVIINRRLVLGGGGYSLSSENIRTGFRFDNTEPASLRLDYGGLEVEYITRPSELVHVTFYTLFGGGQAYYESVRETSGTVSTQRLDSDVIVIEPAVTLELNVTRWFRTGIGFGYRYVNGSDLPLATDGALGGGAGTLSFKFGRF
jgi:hypothetical protein